VAEEGEVDLVGSWFVLVHYKNSATENPDAERWLDQLWVFEREEEGLVWTEYPLVVFRDETGRFEKLGTRRAKRVIHHWEPDEGQLANIRAGLEINPRGRIAKTLSGSDAEGWRSASRARPGSASVISYQQNWSIAGLPRLPVFRQEEVMSSLRSESLEGVTRFETQEVGGGGDLVRGRYDRDGTRVGSFRMLRSGGAVALPQRDPRDRPRFPPERGTGR
jgi:hypothetical protein